MKQQSFKLYLWHGISIASLLGLIFLILIWNIWLTPVQKMPLSLELLILLLPLIFLVRGILYGRISSHILITLVSLYYFLLGIWYSMSIDEEFYGYLLTFFSLGMYLGGYFYTKLLTQEQKKHDNKTTKKSPS